MAHIILKWGRKAPLNKFWHYKIALTVPNGYAYYVKITYPVKPYGVSGNYVITTKQCDSNQLKKAGLWKDGLRKTLSRGSTK